MTTPRCRCGKVSRKCSSTGTDTLYGRFATSTVGLARQLGDPQRVGVDDRERAVRDAVLRRRLGQLLGEPVVDLDGGDGCPGLEDRERQRAEPGPDLDDVLARARPGRRARSCAPCWRRRRSSGRASWSASRRVRAARARISAGAEQGDGHGRSQPYASARRPSLDGLRSCHGAVDLAPCSRRAARRTRRGRRRARRR